MVRKSVAVTGRIPDSATAEREREAVTDAVARFYRELPFNYEQTDDQAARTAADHNQVASAYPSLDAVLRLARQEAVLDVGCGAGWFVNTVAYHYRLPVVGLDLCEPALDRARAITKCLGMERLVQYHRRDLFQAREAPLCPSGRFFLVNSLGVLHHTFDCRQAFMSIAELVAPGGFIHIGLYHAYGRRPFLELFQPYREAYETASSESGRRAAETQALRLYQELNPSVSDGTMLHSWCRDQVLHPHESQHTLQEVSGWLAELGFTCVSTSINRFEPVRDWRTLFEEERYLSEVSYQRNVVDKRYFPGFFVVLARRG